MTHVLQAREPNRIPATVILGKCHDCLSYKLSSCTDGLPTPQLLVLLEKENPAN